MPSRSIIASIRRFYAFILLLLRSIKPSAFTLFAEKFSTFANKCIGVLKRFIHKSLVLVSLWARRFLGIIGSRTKIDIVVTFVIPVFDRTDVLNIAIKSALNQTFSAFEVIIVADGSPKDTLDIIDCFKHHKRVRIFRYPSSSGNAVRARNKGILEAKGRYIAFLDSDDIASSTRLEVCLPLLENDSADVVYGGWKAIIDGTRVADGLVNGQTVYSPDCDYSKLLQICVPCQSTVIVRRSYLLHTGFLKSIMKYREDHELWLRLAFNGARFKSVPLVLAHLRLHSGNNELNFKEQDSYWKSLMIKEHKIPGPKPRKVCFILETTDISGGVRVVLEYISMLNKAGHDAFILSLDGLNNTRWSGMPDIRVISFNDNQYGELENIDFLFATFWTTTKFLNIIPAKNKCYLVQSDERLFYNDPKVKLQVENTYRLHVNYFVVAKWLQTMLAKEFNKESILLPNGIDLSVFYPDAPLCGKDNRRPRVLLEGPISVAFKGVHDAYQAIKDIDCEIWIVSSHGKPPIGWQYDKFFEAVSQDEMRGIYNSCDILLKMSKVESFSYPPLEAMACGCAVVTSKVSGAIEYARHGENMLVVPIGDILQAKKGVLSIINSKEIKERLVKGGFATVNSINWASTREKLLKFVNDTGS